MQFKACQKSLKSLKDPIDDDDKEMEVVQLRQMVKQMNHQMQAKDSEIQQLRRLPSSTSQKVM